MANALTKALAVLSVRWQTYRGVPSDADRRDRRPLWGQLCTGCATTQLVAYASVTLSRLLVAYR